MMSMVSLMASLYFLGQNNEIEMQHYFIHYVMPLSLASHDNKGTVNGTDANTGTSTSNKGHKIPLNNHLIIPNSMVSLMVPLASC